LDDLRGGSRPSKQKAVAIAATRRWKSAILFCFADVWDGRNPQLIEAEFVLGPDCFRALTFIALKYCGHEPRPVTGVNISLLKV